MSEEYIEAIRKEFGNLILDVTVSNNETYLTIKKKKMRSISATTCTTR